MKVKVEEEKTELFRRFEYRFVADDVASGCVRAEINESTNFSICATRGEQQ